jgi:hypothetical protein
VAGLGADGLPADLTDMASRRYRMGMAQTYMVFDFGTNEELAQQARHKIEGWKQGFRLGEKMSMKFERVAAEAPGDGGKPAKKSKEGKEAADHVTVLVRLAFSDHEKLSYQRWVDRIPTEEPFQSAKGEVVRAGDGPEFEKIAERFESLD